MDILALHISSMTDWLNIILHPETIGIPLPESHVIIFGLLGTKLIMMIWFQTLSSFQLLLA
jgi:hypothetical protein